MTEPTDRRISRPALERHLHELTGFSADSAEITASMTLVDAYVVSQLAAFSEAPPAVAESFQHQLMQQAELLLDSAPGIGALNQRVTELITAVNQVTESLYGRLRDLEAAVADLAPQPVIALTDAERETVREALEPAPEVPVVVRVAMADLYNQPLPQAERLLAYFSEKELEDQSAGARRRLTGEQELFCRHCSRWKEATAEFWYRNAKSPTGWETRCRECRPAKKRAA